MRNYSPCNAGPKWMGQITKRPRSIHTVNVNTSTLLILIMISASVYNTTIIGDKSLLFCQAADSSTSNQCYSCSDNNPCDAENTKDEEFYFTHCDVSKFVQCDAFGSCFELQCITGAIWDPRISTCILQRSSDISFDFPTTDKRMNPNLIITPSPSTKPSLTKSLLPSAPPSQTPTLQHNQLSTQLSSKPSLRGSAFPSNTPVSEPSSKPPFEASSEPTSELSAIPSMPPSLNYNEPFFSPTSLPSEVPSSKPDLHPSVHPSQIPRLTHTFQPSIKPNAVLSNSPSAKTTILPSSTPSPGPSTAPTYTPSFTPSMPPSLVPFSTPSIFPSEVPSGTPTSNPSFAPSSVPSWLPSTSPSNMPITQVYKKCGMNINERATKIRDMLHNVSNPDLLQSNGTPQNKAFQWITQDDIYISCPQDINLLQRYTMAVFYFSTSGGQWDECNAPTIMNDAVEVDEKNNQCSIRAKEDSNDDAWLTPSNECLWGGLACDNGLITMIQFGDDGLRGTLPTELQYLDSLQYLLLEDGRISGAIPSEYGKLSNLRVLDFNYNLLSGTVPLQIYNLPNLLQLDLNDNFLGGTISPLIANLKDLEFLQLHRNLFSGTIPEEMGLMKELHVVDLHDNMLTGSMPDSVCKNRDNQGGLISQLSADCDDSFGFAMVDCSLPDCCTSC